MYEPDGKYIEDPYFIPKHCFDGIDPELYPDMRFEMNQFAFPRKVRLWACSPKYRIDHIRFVLTGEHFAFNSEIYKKVVTTTTPEVFEVRYGLHKKVWIMYNAIKVKNGKRMFFEDDVKVDVITNYEELGLTRRQLWRKKAEQVKQKFIMCCQNGLNWLSNRWRQTLAALKNLFKIS